MSVRSPEPWLRGPIEGLHPCVMPIFFSFAQVREDLREYAANLPTETVWREISGMTLGFHLKHIAGSVDRLTTYLCGDQLTLEQLDELSKENEPNASIQELLSLVDNRLTHSEKQLASLNPKTLYDQRTVGRRALPTTVIGLLVHLCEHTQRHLGQAITLAKMLK